MKTLKLLFCMLTIIAISACDNTNSIVPSFNDKAITVTATITQHTRVGYESGVLMPERFIMDITQGDNARYDYHLIEMTKETDGNSYCAPEGMELLWANDSHNAWVKAMTVPMGLSTMDAENVMTINVSSEQNNAINVAASDVLGATSDANGGITISGSNINVEFRHLLSKLDVKYTFRSEFDENSVTVNSITLQNICTSGGYSYADMDYDSTNLKYGDIVMYNNTSASTAEAIFYPYRPAENPSLLINATIDGIEYDFTCPVVAKEAEGFVGGKRYTMNVTIVGSAVDGTEVSIAKGWDTDTNDEYFVTE